MFIDNVKIFLGEYCLGLAYEVDLTSTCTLEVQD